MALQRDAAWWGCGVKDNPNRAIVASPDEEKLHPKSTATSPFDLA
jgi:hypothetical protein